MKKCIFALIVLGVLFTTCVFADEAQEVAKNHDVYVDSREDITSLGLIGGYQGEAFNQNRMGYFHPFVSLRGFYTDNLFNTDNAKESEHATVVSPGIWFALPAARQRLIDVDTLSTAPGGLAVTRFKTNDKRRFQGYGLYRADITNYDDNSDKDHTNQTAEALLNVNLRGGLSIELLDVYNVSHNDFNSGDSTATALDKYHSNLLNAIASYRISPKLTIRADYSFFNLDYDATSNDYRDRTDNLYSGYIFYSISTKLKPFIQYEHIETDYDEDIQGDSDEDNVYAGFEWRVSNKTHGLVKAGYGDKNYDNSTVDSRGEFLFEAQVNHRFTPKTSVSLTAVSRAYATDIQGTRDVLSQRAYLGYRQKLTPKLLAKISLSYITEEYGGAVTVGSQTAERDDNKYGASLDLGYSVQRWLNISVGCSYQRRDSNFDLEDYSRNNIFINITAAL